MGRTKYLQVLEVVHDWEKSVHKVLQGRLSKLKVGDTGELSRSIKTDVMMRSEGMIYIELTMRARGRFRDMGVGRGVDFETALMNTERDKSRGAKRARTPNYWYSRAFFGRLNSLQSALGYKAMHEVSEMVHSAFDRNFI